MAKTEFDKVLSSREKYLFRRILQSVNDTGSRNRTKKALVMLQKLMKEDQNNTDSTQREYEEDQATDSYTSP